MKELQWERGLIGGSKVGKREAYRVKTERIAERGLGRRCMESACKCSTVEESLKETRFTTSLLSVKAGCLKEVFFAKL